ncbi:conserved protein of unknown function [Paenibacillus alvei]|uniref:Uncharacterized protein n=1 Tax=Paenibacillus alvei TaxID=44250 RepID=A0A383RDI3_PAEAL|nr:conserved protein of unknown function [Paenibacillus alvei]
MRPRCGCGKLADCLVYEDKREPHCQECAMRAAECDVGAMVYVPADWSEWKMQLSVRISASEDIDAQRCLIAVGGKIVLPKGKPPQFHFPSNVTYNEYCRLLRKTKEKKAN